MATGNIVVSEKECALLEMYKQLNLRREVKKENLPSGSPLCQNCDEEWDLSLANPICQNCDKVVMTDLGWDYLLSPLTAYAVGENFAKNEKRPLFVGKLPLESGKKFYLTDSTTHLGKPKVTYGMARKVGNGLFGIT